MCVWWIGKQVVFACPRPFDCRDWTVSNSLCYYQDLVESLAALLVAKLDNEELDIEPYRKEIERMAREIQAALPKSQDGKAKLDALNKYLFQERGFHGSRGYYYNRSNSYLNEVLDDREGIPITLSVLYIELARRLGLKVVGVPLPRHFVVQYLPEKGDGRLIDVFEGGKTLTRQGADKRVQELGAEPLTDSELKPAGKKAIIVRMLHNLLGIADAAGTLHYLDAILAIDPDAAHDRLVRARKTPLFPTSLRISPMGVCRSLRR